MATKNNLSTRFKQPWLLLLLAIGAAGGVAFLAYGYLQQREARIKEEVTRSARSATPKVAVAVPLADAAVGTVIDKSTFSARAIEQDLVYPDTVLARDFESLEGQKLAQPVLKGRPLRLTDLQAPDVKDVASVLPPGTRALTIDIDTINSISHTLRPGHRVDIFLVNQVSRGSDTDTPEEALRQAELFMQNMQVLATGQEFRDLRADTARSDKMIRPGDLNGTEKPSFDTVTLLVTPPQAAKLLVGQKMGSYRVALRGSKDFSVVNLAALRSGDLMPVKVKSRDEGIEFIIGGKSAGADIVSTRGVRPALPPEEVKAAPAPANIGKEIERALRQIGTPRRPGAVAEANPAAQPVLGAASPALR